MKNLNIPLPDHSHIDALAEAMAHAVTTYPTGADWLDQQFETLDQHIDDWWFNFSNKAIELTPPGADMELLGGFFELQIVREKLRWRRFVKDEMSRALDNL